MYYPDPVEAIRRLAGHLQPKGLLVFHEFDMTYVRSYPSAPILDQVSEWMKQALGATGTRIQIGTELYRMFLAAGLPGPSLRMDVLIGGAQFQGYEILAELIRSLLPVMEDLGIATAAQVDFPTLAERM